MRTTPVPAPGGRSARPWVLPLAALALGGAMIGASVTAATSTSLSPSADEAPQDKPAATQIDPELVGMIQDVRDQARAKGVAVPDVVTEILADSENPALRTNTAITGMVTTAADGHAAGAMVEAYDTEGNLMANVLTNSAGSYTMTNLQPGPYVIRVVPSATQAASWATTWAPAEPSFNTAGVITTGARTARANVRLGVAARFTPTFVVNGAPLAGVAVEVCGLSARDCVNTLADASGAVHLAGLPTTKARIGVTTADGSRYEFATVLQGGADNTGVFDISTARLVVKGS